MIRGVSVCSSLSSLLLFFLLLSGAEAPKQKNKKKIETEWTDPPPHLSPALSPSLSLPLTVQISFPYFLQPSSIFMLSPVSSISLSLPPPSLFFFFFFSLSACYRSLLDSGQDTVFQLTWIAAPPVGLQPSRCSLTRFGCVLTRRAHTHNSGWTDISSSALLLFCYELSIFIGSAETF